MSEDQKEKHHPMNLQGTGAPPSTVMLWALPLLFMISLMLTGLLMIRLDLSLWERVMLPSTTLLMMMQGLLQVMQLCWMMLLWNSTVEQRKHHTRALEKTTWLSTLSLNSWEMFDGLRHALLCVCICMFMSRIHWSSKRRCLVVYLVC